jgi:hypothetical protein
MTPKTAPCFAQLRLYRDSALEQLFNLQPPFAQQHKRPLLPGRYAQVELPAHKDQGYRIILKQSFSSYIPILKNQSYDENN